MGTPAAPTFLSETLRIAAELRRSNLTNEIKSAINDAITEADGDRYFFNEVRGDTFNTVYNTEMYDDMGLSEIDTMYLLYNSGPGGTPNANARLQIYPTNNQIMNDWTSSGAVIIGPPRRYARTVEMIRLYPIPDQVYVIAVDGYKGLTLLVDDNDTNNWLLNGELYIRALAKRNVLRDVIKDFKEASIFDAQAEDYKQDLIDRSTIRFAGNDELSGTQW
jgi:hypothetical protein